MNTDSNDLYVEDASMAQPIVIKFPSEPKFLKIVRSTISHVCETMGFSQEDTNNVTLAVDEACSNIIKHSYCGATNQLIEVIIHLHHDRLEVLLRDFGKKVDVSQIKSRQLDDVRPGGLGVHLIKSVMDIVNYENQSEAGNELQLVKYRRNKG
jgi:anti-sigma regulatory factor (Ser/Thr protein kinase)